MNMDVTGKLYHYIITTMFKKKLNGILFKKFTVLFGKPRNYINQCD